MKKFAIIALSIFSLTACVGTGTTPVATGTNTTPATTTTATQDVATTIFAQMMDNQCRAQLNAIPFYQSTTSFMTADQKNVLESNVCGCVSEESLKNVNLTDVITAGLDKSAQTRLVTQALGKTLQTCATKFLTGQ